MGERPIAARRKAAAQSIVEDEQHQDPSQEHALDETAKVDASLAHGSVAEGDEFNSWAEIQARKLGWAPKEEWKRAPEDWRDPKTFLEEMPDHFDRLRESNRQAQERSKRMTQAAADAIEEGRRQARLEAQAEIRAAAESDDPDRGARAEAAAKRLAEIPAEAPLQTRQWIARNGWFETEPHAKALAMAVANELSTQGATIDAQLEAAETEVRRRYPELFPTQRRDDPPQRQPEPEVRMSEVRRASPPPAVAPASRSPGGATPKVKGYEDIPRSDRMEFEAKLMKKFLGRGLTEQQVKERFATSYWRETSN